MYRSTSNRSTRKNVWSSQDNQRQDCCVQLEEEEEEEEHLLNAQALLVHVAQVEHGLGAVLLLWGQPVVDDGRLVVHVRAVAVEVVVPQLDPGHRVAWNTLPPVRDHADTPQAPGPGTSYSFLRSIEHWAALQL